jgi:phosphonate transport system substrate-binding protein
MKIMGTDPISGALVLKMGSVPIFLLAACFSQPQSYVPPPRPPAPRELTVAVPAGLTNVRMGLVPHMSPDRMRASRTPLVKYLSQGLHVPVEMVIGADYDDVGERMSKGEIDVAEFSPFAFVRARKKAKLKPLASAISAGSSTSGGYIIVREDSNRKTLEDLRGARFGFVDPASTSGYLFPLKVFRAHGIDPNTYFSSTVFMGSHDAVLLGLLDGGIEAGATWQGSISALRAERGVDPLEFRIIAKMPRTPQDVVCVRDDLDPALAAAIRTLVLRLSVRDHEDREVLNAMGINGYVDVDLTAYEEVARIASDLDAGEPGN